MFWGITSILFMLGASLLSPALLPGEDLNARPQAGQSSVAKPAPGDEKGQPGQPPVNPECIKNGLRAPGTRPICR
jgi:hypothetical protein